MYKGMRTWCYIIKMIKAIIFDVDDTLINTVDSVFEKFKKIAEILNVKEITRDEFINAWGHTTENLVSELWPDLEYKKFKDAYDKFGYKEPYPLFDGAIDALDYVKNKDILMGILTSRRKETLILRAKQAGLDLDYFKFIQTEDDTDIHKPNPKVFEPILEKFNDLGIKNNEILYVGDNLFDAKAALGNNLHFLAVLTGTTKKEEFLKEGVKEENVLNSIKEFKDWFKNSIES
jgi:phosphoglycolate phosphatase